MPRKQVPGRNVEAIPAVRGTAVRLTPGGSPYINRLPGSDSPQVLDLFCGAGGLSLGFALAGFHVAGGVDADARAMETHAYNFGGYDRPIILSETFQPEDALHQLGVDRSRVKVLIGGPPCQGFARVGRGKIRSLIEEQMTPEEVAEWVDPRNRLYRAYLRFVELLQPPALVMENVPDMARHKDGAVDHLLADLEDLGYTARPFILNAANYGVPQTRHRLVIIGNRLGMPIQAPEPITTGRPVTLKQAINDLPRIRPEGSADVLPYCGVPRSAYARLMRQGLTETDRKLVYDHVVRLYAEDDQQAFDFLPQGGRYIDLPENLQRYRNDVFHDKYHKLYWQRPAWTITAHIAKDGYKYIHPDNAQLRTLTVREAARVQSFPDWFRFAGFRSHRLRQIGNAVPPLLAKAIGEMVIAQLRAAGEV